MISGTTCLVGLLGHPVNHSISPVIQNAAMKAMGLDWCYLAMPCKSENLGLITKALSTLNCQGLNITIPHKESIIDICKHVSPLAKRLGAINTLVPNKKGGWNGLNTDVEGFLAPLQQRKWKGSKAIILGCGGSARAVIAGLQELKVNQIIVVGRREKSLNNFIIDLKKKAFESEKTPIYLKGIMKENKELIDHIKEADLIINATPVGMSAKSTAIAKDQEIPLGKKIWEHLKSKTTLYDLIYTPRPTAWLTLGSQHDCDQIDGLEMLIQQGAASLKLWSNNSQVPIDIMRKAAKKYLSD